jgi:hypothetical protein
VDLGRRLGDRVAGDDTVVTRWRRWEFWPTWAVYPPVVAWLVVQAVRHGGVRPITAANPGLEDGGLVGESKHAIQSLLPAPLAVPSGAIEPGAVRVRASSLFQLMRDHGWRYPIVLKPDVGQRGAGVRKISDAAAAWHYLLQYPQRAVVQPWHPGPYEAGLFYARHPDESHGRIVSITDKIFPVVEGDGRATLAELIDRHPRFRRQAATFRRRHADRLATIPRAGERWRLAEVGNHCQGTLFLDGRALWTPALEARVDAIARAVPGFFIGRFDVRYADVGRFRAGEDLRVIELNGVTAEPTDIYDPSRSLASAYAALFDQWRRVFEIGAANLRRGHAGASLARLLRLGLAHLTDRRAFPVSS